MSSSSLPDSVAAPLNDGPLGPKLARLGLLYFASGLPFVIAQKVWPVIWREAGASLVAVGLLSLLSVPWTIKALWAPLVDRFGRRRAWVAGCLMVMAASSALQGLALSRGLATWELAFVLLLLAFTAASATQDVAIDAYAVEIAGPRQEGPINSTRVVAYRFAMAAGGGALLAAGPALGWTVTWWLLAGLLAVAALLATRLPEPPAHRRAPSPSMVAMLGETWRWLRRPSMGGALAVVLLYKVGDYALAPMSLPFWVDAGYSPAEIGAVAVTLGTLASVVGAVAGGWLTARWGTLPALLALGVAQAASNLGYAAAALLDLGRAGLWTVTLLENLCQGLAVTAFLAFLMRLCGKRQAATRFAVLTALSALPRELVGSVSGLGASHLGYSTYFAVTFLLALPALFLIPRVAGALRGRDGEDAVQGAAGSSSR